MVKKLRRKFVITAMLSLLVILVVLLSVINISNYVQIKNSADETLQLLADNDGFFPEMMKNPRKMDDAKDGETPPSPPENKDIFNEKMAYNRTLEMPFMTRYFFVRTDEDGNTKEIDTGHIAAVSAEDAENYKTEVLKNKNILRGYVNNHYRYLISKQEDGSYLVLFLDCSNSIYSANRLLISTLFIGMVALVAMLILVYLFSGRAVAPVVESLEKQKRFITDAGHELKTPLAVISANVDVIELESGKSEWTESVKNQIKRMNGLVKNMLSLSRMEEENIHLVFSEINISDIIRTSAESFQAVAESKNLKYEKNIEDGIMIMGDKNGIGQLSSLLIDNAMKYVGGEGNVFVFLERDAKKKHVIFEVANTCDSLPEGNLDKLFDRFYRGDSSRSRDTGGYGIGLSVARAIATSHGGTIEALRGGDHTIKFKVRLPLTKK
ncbi:sensor histidine kinase [Butyrivibrio sp. NC2002]|uniref:sensor histidine kinase n=1 Tax=Butyrivibrio sp. NC2002 TaxID=1410610 RepID=UPI00068D314E|nr:HAMP domain-containing sensor histidine kinase [Butyrivibrio sp. NC2002]